jgi:hypothetical protein
MYLTLSRFNCVARHLLLGWGCAFLFLPVCVRSQTNAPLMTPDRPGLSVILPAQSFPVEFESFETPAQEMSFDAQFVDGWLGLAPESAPAVRLPSRAQPAGWISQAGSMKYQQDNGSALVLGQVADDGGFWGASPRLGGIQVTSMPNISSRGTLMPGSFGLSAALGMATDEDLSRQGAGGLSLGAPTGRGRMRLGLTSDFTLETQVQARPEASAVGLGGTLALSGWGVMRLNTTQTTPTAASHAELFAPSRRSNLGMQLNFDRHQLESTYQTVRYNQNAIEQRLGVQHRWQVSPMLNMQFGADRERVSGSYSARMQMSVPLDAVVSPWWRN